MVKYLSQIPAIEPDAAGTLFIMFFFRFGQIIDVFHIIAKTSASPENPIRSECMHELSTGICTKKKPANCRLGMLRWESVLNEILFWVHPMQILRWRVLIDPV